MKVALDQDWLLSRMFCKAEKTLNTSNKLYQLHSCLINNNYNKFPYLFM
jgi:hypothetical protein